MNSSGMASSAVLLAVLAVGAAAGFAVHPDSEVVPPRRVVPREPPGPAQIELAENAAVSVAAPAPAPAPPEELALFAVGAASAISDACSDAAGAQTFTPEAMVCALMSQAVKHIPEVGADFVPLLLGDDLPAR